MDVRPQIVAVCDANPAAMTWFTDALPGVRTYTDYHDLLADGEVEAVYCAVPHNLHAQLYVDILRAGKHLLGEKPFGIDREAYQVIADEMAQHPDLLVRCSSEYPFFPGAQTILAMGAGGPLRAHLRGRERLLALQRPQPQEADQLEAPHRDQRRVRLHRRPRHARGPRCRCAWAGAPATSARCSPRSCRASRTRRRRWFPARRGTTPSSPARSTMVASRSR